MNKIIAFICYIIVAFILTGFIYLVYDSGFDKGYIYGFSGGYDVAEEKFCKNHPEHCSYISVSDYEETIQSYINETLDENITYFVEGSIILLNNHQI